MGLTVNTNITALIAQRNLSINSAKVALSMEKLASGFRINKASDDAAGLNISEILRTQVRGSEVALRNAQDGASLLQVAEGNLNSVTENIQRIRELTVQAANDTYGTSERTAIAREVVQRVRDIQRVSLSARFNNIELLSGNTSVCNIQIGPNSTNTDYMSISAALQETTIEYLFGAGFASTDITVAAGGMYEDGTAARTFLLTLDTALDNLFSRRSNIGAFQSRLDSVISNLQISIENLSASESRIRDLDVASETTKLTKNQILQQASLSVLSQANNLPTLALKLMG